MPHNKENFKKTRCLYNILSEKGINEEFNKEKKGDKTCTNGSEKVTTQENYKNIFN